MGEPVPLSDLAEVISVDQVSETMQAAIGNSGYGPDKEELVRDDWVEFEVVPAGASPTDRYLPFLIAPACEIDAGQYVQLSGALLVTNLVYDEPEGSEDPDELIRDVYLATKVEERGGGIWTLASPKRGGRISKKGLKYWDDASLVPAECRCGWSGTAGHSIPEDFSELYTLRCPACEATLFKVSFPTLEQTRAAAAAGNRMAQAQKAFDDSR